MWATMQRKNIILTDIKGDSANVRISSMFQSIGFSHPRYTPMIKTLAAVFAWILIAGFISVPVAVLTGMVR